MEPKLDVHQDNWAYGFRLAHRLLPQTSSDAVVTILLGLTGILSDFTAPLKDAKVPVFAVSTWFVMQLGFRPSFSLESD